MKHTQLRSMLQIQWVPRQGAMSANVCSTGIIPGEPSPSRAQLS